MFQTKKPRSESQDGMNASENQIVVYQPNETVRLDVRLENETVWLTQAQLCDLFGVVKSNISYHLKNIFGTNELDYGATVQKIRTVRTEAGRTVSRDIEYFNLDVIISLGYRINSRLGIQFRQWATRVLKEYLLHGQVVNQRLAQFEDKVDRRLANHDDRIAMLEEKVDFFVQTKEPPLQSIFYQNKFWDAKSLLIKFIRRAKKELICDALQRRAGGIRLRGVRRTMRKVHEDHLRNLPRPFHHRRSEGNFLDRRIAEGRRPPDLRCSEDGRRGHSRASRINPQGDE